jgi:hypothetical protein
MSLISLCPGDLLGKRLVGRQASLIIKSQLTFLRCRYDHFESAVGVATTLPRLPQGATLSRNMSSANPDHRTSFLRNFELYERAKQQGADKEVRQFALLALTEIHQISDVPAHADREANVQVMHDLLGPVHTEDEIREKYDRLREDAGV